MKLKNIVEDQIASDPLCFLKNPGLPWILAAGLVQFLIFSGLLGFGFFSIIILLTSAVLILSTIYFSLSNQKPAVLAEKSVEISPPMEMEDEGLNLQIQEDTVRSVDSIAESDKYLGHSSSSTSEEDSDHEEDNAEEGSLDCSDGSISDEESLIEIALPSGQYVGPKKEEAKINLQQKLPDFTHKPLFHQHSTLMELLAEINHEINEEENLIEIDISVGSIKCSRFEIY